MVDLYAEEKAEHQATIALCSRYRDALNAIATRSRTISSAKAVAIYALGNDYCEDRICEKDHI